MSTRRQAQQGKTQVAVGETLGHGLRIVDVQSLRDDQDFIAFLTGSPFVRCGIDAPLSLPPCVLCRVCPCDCVLAEWAVLLGYEPDLVYHYRLSDLVIRKTVPGVAPKPPLSNGGPVDITPLSLRWLRLSRQLYLQGLALENVVEVYATGTIQILAQVLGLVEKGVFRYRASAERRAQLLCALAEQQWLSASAALWEQIVTNEDTFDAVIACLSAYLAEHHLILQPDVLLGLRETGAVLLVQPLQVGSEDSRREMLRALQKAPWVALPDPAKVLRILEM